MSAPELIALAMLLPFVGAVLIGMSGDRPNQRETVTIVTAIATFLCVLGIYPEVAAGGRPELVLFPIVPGIDLSFKVEPLGMLFSLVASFLWIVTSIYSIGYMRGHHEGNQTRFYICFAVAIGSTLALAFAGNMFTLFIGYEILTVSTYPLVTHHQTPEAMRAGRTYLGILLTTSICFQLTAIIWTWSAAGTLDFTPGGILADKIQGPALGLMLFLYVFGIGKAALMPIHRWLPAAMVAPTPVSALLHAVAVVKAGVFTVLKVVIYIFGIETLRKIEASDLLMYVAAFTIIVASLVALTKDNLKARLAYSTVSQLAYIVLGGALFVPMGIIGGAMHIAMHAMGKITLFFCAGAILVATHKTEISEMRGIGRVMPVTIFAFLIGSLSIIGLPPFAGLWSKWYLALGALDDHQLVLVGVLMVSSLLNIAYLLPIPFRGFFSPPDNPGPGAAVEIKEAPLPCLIAIVITAAGCLALFFYPDPAYQLMEAVVAR